MDGVEARETRKPREEELGREGYGDDGHGDGEPLVARLLPHQRRAIALELVFLEAAAISPARATETLPPLSSSSSSIFLFSPPFARLHCRGGNWATTVATVGVLFRQLSGLFVFCFS